MSLVFHTFAAPDNFSRQPVQSNNGSVAAAWRNDNLVAVNQWAFAESPAGDAASEVILEVLGPDDFSGFRFQSGEISTAAFGINKSAMNCWSASSTVTFPVFVESGFAWRVN